MRQPLKYIIKLRNLRSLNLARSQASGASVNVTGSAVNYCLYSLYIGLPGSVGSSVRVGYLDTIYNLLAAVLTLCHYESTSF